MKNRLTLHQLVLSLHLGWQQEERAHPQSVWVDIELYFDDEIHACHTDQLTDTICYDTLVTTLKDHLIHREFFLIEHLTFEIYQIVKKNVSQKTGVNICVTKKPKIEGLLGGVSFIYGDL